MHLPAMSESRVPGPDQRYFLYTVADDGRIVHGREFTCASAEEARVIAESIWPGEHRELWDTTTLIAHLPPRPKRRPKA
ncbi:MAG: hypothetical protein BGN86_03430 [Caulobacterales bacterium 68-7]|nr:MAG: hypothetical protein BGN86_03430 [Caulobacterales bacterium 68-7]